MHHATDVSKHEIYDIVIEFCVLHDLQYFLNTSVLFESVDELHHGQRLTRYHAHDRVEGLLLVLSLEANVVAVILQYLLRGKRIIAELDVGHFVLLLYSWREDINPFVLVDAQAEVLISL